jgi:hypothetical protein
VVDEAAMKTRTSLILAVVAVGLAAFIYFFERHQPTTDELHDREARVLPGFDRDQVDHIVIGTGDGRVELERVEAEGGDAGPIGAVGQWKMTRPRALGADPEAVDNLLSTLDWLERRRVVEMGKAGQTPAKLGLAEPRQEVSLRLRGRDVSLKLGGEAPGKGLYLAVSTEPGKAYVVDQEVLEKISLGPNDLRDKRLVVVTVLTTEAVRVAGRFHAVRRGPGEWALEAPVKMRARAARVEDVVRGLEELRAARFVADEVAEGDLARYGLDRPAREATLRLEGSSAPVTLRFGGPCEGHDEEIYATALGTGTVACVSQGVLDTLGADPLTMRDLRPTGLDLIDVERIEITRGAAQLTLRREGEGWRIAGEGASSTAAETAAVEGFLEALRGEAQDVTAELAGTGLEGDAAGADVVVRLVKPEGSDEREERIAFAVETERVLARRGDEPVALVLPVALEAAGTLAADPIRFRDRQLLDEDESTATELELTAAPPAPRQLVTKQGDHWQVTAPVSFRADDVVVGDLVRALAGLRAERFVASAPAAEHGLSRPRFRLRVTFTPAAGGGDAGPAADGGDGGAAHRAPVDRVILVGNQVEGGGAYARLEGADQTVFVLPDEFVASLRGPLVDRNLFAIDGEQVQGLVIERAGAPRVELERSGDAWRAVGQGAAQPPAGAVQAIFTALATARAAEAISYGPPAAETGLRAPPTRLVARITADEQNEERVLLLGTAYGEEGSGRRVYARRDGVDATFGLPERVARPIIEFGQAPAPAGDVGAAAEPAGDGGATGSDL